MRSIVFTVLVVVCFCICSCSENLPIDGNDSSKFQNFPKEPCFRSAGVVIYSDYHTGWVENTNEFPVQIRAVCESGYTGSDKTLWVLTFGAKQIKKVSVGEGNGWETPIRYFHIYDIEGKPIGFIHPEKP